MRVKSLKRFGFNFTQSCGKKAIELKEHMLLHNILFIQRPSKLISYLGEH